MGRTLLDREVVKHIDQCFTQKGMNTSVKRGSYSKSRIVLGAEEDEAVEQDKEKRDQECQVSGRLAHLNFTHYSRWYGPAEQVKSLLEVTRKQKTYHQARII